MFRVPLNTDLNKILPQGNWSAGCIAVSFSMSLSLPSDPKNATKTMDITLDPSKKGVTATMMGSCDTTEAGIQLTWKDMDSVNKNNTLDRMVSMTFTKNATKDGSGSYGVTAIMGMAEIK